MTDAHQPPRRVTEPFSWSEVGPVLDAVYWTVSEAASEPMSPVASAASIQERLGREPGDRTTWTAVQALADAGYLKTDWGISQATGEIEPNEIQLTEKALQRVANWPATTSDEIASRILEVVERRIAEAPEGDERSRLVRIRDGLAKGGRDIFVEVVAQALNPGSVIGPGN